MIATLLQFAAGTAFGMVAALVLADCRGWLRPYPVRPADTAANAPDDDTEWLDDQPTEVLTVGYIDEQFAIITEREWWA